MESQSHALTAFSPPPGTVSRCPFHDGPLTLDALLAELAPEETAALDLGLDLRQAMVARSDAVECVTLALRLRHALAGRHYLAFYRLRHWLRRVIAVQARAWRGHEWTTFELPLNSARLDEIENACRAAWTVAYPATCAEALRVRFVFRAATASSSGSEFQPAAAVAMPVSGAAGASAMR